jgi:hypothetical protein
MLEQKKLPILEALAAFGIGGIFTAACMAGLAYLMANQSLAQSTAWPMVSAIVCAGSFCHHHLCNASCGSSDRSGHSSGS